MYFWVIKFTQISSLRNKKNDTTLLIDLKLNLGCLTAAEWF